MADEATIDLVELLRDIELRARTTLANLNNGTATTGAAGVQGIWYMARDGLRHATGRDPVTDDAT